MAEPWRPDPKERLSVQMAAHDFDDGSHPSDYAPFVLELEEENLHFRHRHHDMKHRMIMQGHEVQEQEARLHAAKDLCKQFIEKGRTNPGHPCDMEHTAGKILALLQRPMDIWPENLELLELREMREAYTALLCKHQEVCIELARRVTEDNKKDFANSQASS